MYEPVITFSFFITYFRSGVTYAVLSFPGYRPHYLCIMQKAGTKLAQIKIDISER